MELSPMGRDILSEMSNISMGSAATTLSGLLKRAVRLLPPEIEEMTTVALQERYNGDETLLRTVFRGALEGTSFLLLPGQDAAFLSGLVPDSAGQEALGRAMDAAMGSYSASLAAFLGVAPEQDMPLVEQIDPANRDLATLGFAAAEHWIVFDFGLEIEQEGSIHIAQLFPLSFLRDLLTPFLQALGMDITEIFSGDPATGGDPPHDDSLAELRELLDPSAEPLSPAADSFPSLDDYLSEMEKDTLAEIGNISLGSSATALSQLIEQRVEITIPELSLTTMERLGGQYFLTSVVASINYQKGLQGESILILKEKDAALIAGLMLGLPADDAPKEAGEMEMSAVSEAMNQMIGFSATAMSDFLDREIDISPPRLIRIDLEKEKVQVEGISPQEPVLQLSFRLKIGDLLESRLIQVIPLPFAKEITSFLLQGVANGAKDVPDQGPPAAGLPPVYLPEDVSGETLSAMQRDALAEVGNISLGSSATALSELIDKKVNITAPQVTLTTMREVGANYPLPCLVVMVDYIKGLDGNNVLIIKKEDALVIVGLMMGMEPPEKPAELGEMELSAISEAMNQMMGSAATAMADFLERPIDISPPELIYTKLEGQGHLDTLHFDEDIPLVQIAFRMEVEGLIDSSLLQLIPLDFARDIAAFLLSSLGGLDMPAFPEPTPARGESGPGGPQEIFPQEEAKVPVAGDMGEQAAAVVAFPVEPAQKLQDEELAKLNLIRNIPLEIRAVLGKARVPLKKVFSLVPGNIVSLNRFLGEPVELYAHERLVATGEIVLINGQFGVKIIEMARPGY